MNDAIDLGVLGFDRGAHILIRFALDELDIGQPLMVRGQHADLERHLHAWCRAHGHGAPEIIDGALCIKRGSGGRWHGAVQSGDADVVIDAPSSDWSFAPRGAFIEAGGPPLSFAIDHKDEIWSDSAPRTYAQAASNQWDPHEAVEWDAPITHDDIVEQAVVSVMAYLVENEEAALVVPARFLGQIHPHFREVQQVFAVQIADEARHIEVFTRRANLLRPMHVLSTVGGRRSLQTLVEEPDFAVASFLLSVLGEGTFLSLLGFLERHAPDSITRRVAQLSRQDEARHVAFGMAHLERHLQLEPGLRARLAQAVERRHTALTETAGLNEEVFDALVILASGSTSVESIANGWDLVQDLQKDMHEQRRARMARLGFTTDEADRLSSMHTRNFM